MSLVSPSINSAIANSPSILSTLAVAVADFIKISSPTRTLGVSKNCNTKRLFPLKIAEIRAITFPSENDIELMAINNAWVGSPFTVCFKALCAELMADLVRGPISPSAGPALNPFWFKAVWMSC